MSSPSPPQDTKPAENQTMRLAQITAWSTTPKPATVPRPPIPNLDPSTPSSSSSSSSLVQVKLLAAGLHTLVRLRTTGTHYSASVLPHIPGTDGVGLTVPDNKLVYFSTMMLPAGGGSFAEYVNVPRGAVTPVPAGVDPVRVAGLVNPVMASWMALATRVDFSGLSSGKRGEEGDKEEMKGKGFTVVILGITSLSGTVAASVARLFGAGRVVGVGRNLAKMEGIEGVDEFVQLKSLDDGGGEDVTEWKGALEADVVLDFLYGPATLSLFRALKPGNAVQYVQLGTSASPTIENFPGDIFRNRDLTVRGSGPGAWMTEQFRGEVKNMVEAVATGKIRAYKGFKKASLGDVERVWDESARHGERVVFVP